MSDALTLILNGLLQGNLDCGGFKLLNLDTSNLGEFTNQVPFEDSQAIIKGSVDPTKLARFEVDGFTTATTRVFTLPNYNAQLASLAGAEDFTNKSYNGLILTADGSAELTIEDATVLIQGNVLLAGPFTLAGGFLTTLNVTGITDLDLPTSGTVATTDQLPVISDVAYNEATWNGNLDAASKNSLRDKFESLVTAPFSDATALVKGSGNNLKMFKIEVDGLSTGTRVMTPPDYDFTPASIAGEESLIKKRINGLLVSVGDAASAGGAVTYDESPDFPFNLSLVAISQSGTSGVIRTTAPFDVVMPVSGTLAIVAETIALASLDTDKDLGAALASDTKVPSQRAVKLYTDAHTGVGAEEVSGATLASATSVDLSGTAARQITITGTTPIEQFILDEGDEKVLVFEDDLDLVAGEFLATKGGEDSPVKAGSYVIVRGKADAVVEVVHSQTATGYQDETFNNIFMEPGGNIGFANLLSPFFVLGDHKGDTGNYLRVTAGEYLKFVDKNNDGSISLDTSLLSNTERIQKFCDVDGIFGMYVPAPAAHGDDGTDGQWSTDDTYLYAFSSAQNKWGRVALSFAFP